MREIERCDEDPLSAKARENEIVVGRSFLVHASAMHLHTAGKAGAVAGKPRALVRPCHPVADYSTPRLISAGSGFV